jgi:hypothetical protein
MNSHKPLLRVVFFLLSIFAFVGVSQAQVQKVAAIRINRLPTTYGCITGANPNGEVPVYSNSTGRQDLDAAVLTEITEINKQFDVWLPVYFEISKDKNAFFTSEKYPDLIMADTGKSDLPLTGSLVIGVALWQDEMVSNSGYAIPAIMAHEGGHAAQYKKRFPYEGKWRELHADYMAGWFTGHRGRFIIQNEVSILNSFFNKGDFDFFDKGHHGTPQERANAFMAGYNLNRLSQVSLGTLAYDWGIKYIQNCQQARLCN